MALSRSRRRQWLPSVLVASLVGVSCGGNSTSSQETLPSVDPSDAAEISEPSRAEPPAEIEALKESGESPVVATVLPPVSAPDPDFILPPPEQVQAVAYDPSTRTTAILERGPDGEPGWWMTAWSAETDSGGWVYCLGFSAQGRSCVPDGQGLAGEIQVGGYSVDYDPAIYFLASDLVENVEVVLDGAESAAVRLKLTDLGVPSGLQATGMSLPDEVPSEVRIVASAASGVLQELVVELPEPTEFVVPDGIDLDQSVEALPRLADPLEADYAPKELLEEGI